MTLLTLFHQGTTTVIPPPTPGTGRTTMTVRELGRATLVMTEKNVVHLTIKRRED